MATMEELRNKGRGGKAAVVQQAQNQQVQQNQLQQAQQQAQQQVPGFAPTRSMYQPNTYFGSGANVPNVLNNFLVDGYLNAPGQMVNDINRAFDQFQYYADRQATRNSTLDIVKALMGNMGTQRSNSPRMSGFQDVNSVNAATPTGQVTSGVTVQPMSSGQVDAAVGTVANAAPPQAGSQYAGSAQSALNGHLADLTSMLAGKNAMAFEREAIPENASLGRAAEVARAEDEISKLHWLLQGQWRDAQNQVAQQNRQMQSALPLVGILQGGLA